MGTLNLFPARVAIGKTVDSSGKEIMVFMTPEFARALSGLLDRVGGPEGVPTTDIEQMAIDTAVLQAFEMDPPVVPAPQLIITEQVDSAAAVAALREEVAQLRAELAMQTKPADFTGQIEELRVLYAMQDSNREVIKGTAIGSRAANAALASLLTALARSGLVIDNTTV